MTTELHRIAVGIWIELPDSADWKHHGISRVIGFLIEGGARRGDVVWRLVAQQSLCKAITDDLRALAAQEGRDWTIHSPPVEVPLERSVQTPPEPPTEGIVETLLKLPQDIAPDPFGWTPRQMGQVLFVAGIAALPLLVLRSALRSVLRPITTRLRLIVALARDPVAFAPQLADAATRLPCGLGSKAAQSLRSWAAAHTPHTVADLGCCPTAVPDSAPGLLATPDLAESQLDPLAPAPHFRVLAMFANAQVPVQGWLVPYPSSVASRLLIGPRAVLFPDAIPYLMPMGWHCEFSRPDSGYPLWRALATHTLEGATAIITFSDHVKRAHGAKFFPDGVPVVVAPPAPPDLSPMLAVCSEANASPTSSRSVAAGVIRRHAATCAWRYLADFPFEHATYIAVSTQDRPTKNVQLIVASLERLVRRRFVDCKLLMTTPLWHGASWTDLPQAVSGPGLDLDVISMPGLPRDVHAAFYHCAALVVHASFLEGIVGTLPFFEAVSVGTPCLMADGPHVRELLQHHALADTVFDPFDVDDLADLILRALTRRDELLASQTTVFAAFGRRDWSAVAAEYAGAATGHVFPTRCANTE
jgi:glycosyltransferase involved in cell wall biosynthesis